MRRSSGKMVKEKLERGRVQAVLSCHVIAFTTTIAPSNRAPCHSEPARWDLSTLYYDYYHSTALTMVLDMRVAYNQTSSHSLFYKDAFHLSRMIGSLNATPLGRYVVSWYGKCRTCIPSRQSARLTNPFFCPTVLS